MVELSLFTHCSLRTYSRFHPGNWLSQYIRATVFHHDPTFDLSRVVQSGLLLSPSATAVPKPSNTLVSYVPRMSLSLLLYNYYCIHNFGIEILSKALYYLPASSHPTLEGPLTMRQFCFYHTFCFHKAIDIGLYHVT